MDLLQHRAEFSPCFPDPAHPDPTWLPHYYVQAEKFCLHLSLFHAVDYTVQRKSVEQDNEEEIDRGIPLPKMDDEVPKETKRSSSPPRPTGRMSFECILFKDTKHQNTSKLVRNLLSRPNLQF